MRSNLHFHLKELAINLDRGWVYKRNNYFLENIKYQTEKNTVVRICYKTNY